MVHYSERVYIVSMVKGLNRGFVKPREFIKKLLARIRGTRHLVPYTGKFVISGVRYTGIQLYDFN